MDWSQVINSAKISQYKWLSRKPENTHLSNKSENIGLFKDLLSTLEKIQARARQLLSAPLLTATEKLWPEKSSKKLRVAWRVLSNCRLMHLVH